MSTFDKRLKALKALNQAQKDLEKAIAQEKDLAVGVRFMPSGLPTDIEGEQLHKLIQATQNVEEALVKLNYAKMHVRDN